MTNTLNCLLNLQSREVRELSKNVEQLKNEKAALQQKLNELSDFIRVSPISRKLFAGGRIKLNFSLYQLVCRWQGI